ARKDERIEADQLAVLAVTNELFDGLADRRVGGVAQRAEQRLDLGLGLLVVHRQQSYADFCASPGVTGSARRLFTAKAREINVTAWGRWPSRRNRPRLFFLVAVRLGVAGRAVILERQEFARHRDLDPVALGVGEPLHHQVEVDRRHDAVAE